MRLHRLEIAGFKSFPDRSELTFDRGVTAIVGPNGCGKSNVVDALTWVLGEQSAKSLRGDRMEDVIFGGSDARKPTAAAEVRLKLSGVAARTPADGNGHGSGHGNGGHVMHGAVGASEPALSERTLTRVEGGATAVAVAVEDDTPLIVRDVELMRRLYRSGESEYLIDGEICRLRDVQDLLMDSGLGVKAYAVIEQGKIGQILSARPTDRRQLIEEAAGVTKYKSRRRAAELKLEAAQQNLTRVDDIVFEVEKQRGTLKRQAAKARRYKRLREELRRWEKVQFAQRYRSLGQQIEIARTRLADARQRETLASARLAELETELERLRLDLTEADSATTAARESAHAAELEIGRLQQQIAFDKQQVEQLGVAASEIATEVQALERRREPARQELDARRESARRAADDRDAAAATLAAEEIAYAEVQRQIEGLESDVEAARSEVFAAVNAATALRHAMEHAGAARTRLGEQIGKLEIETGDLNVEVERAERDRAEAAEARDRANVAMEGLARGPRGTRVGARRRPRSARRAGPRAARPRARSGLSRGAAEVHRGARHRAGRVRRRRAGDSGRGSRLPAPRIGGGLPRGGQAVRARRRSLSRRSLAVRRRAVAHDVAAAGLRLAGERSAGRVGFVIRRTDLKVCATRAETTLASVTTHPV